MAVAYVVNFNTHKARIEDGDYESDPESEDEKEESGRVSSNAHIYSGMSSKASSWASKVCVQLLVNSVSTF
jgi:hypothetical protein